MLSLRQRRTPVPASRNFNESEEQSRGSFLEEKTPLTRIVHPFSPKFRSSFEMENLCELSLP